jgi:hypothetical protein
MNKTRAIGGYFELELPKYGSYLHSSATALNSGRNAFAYILEKLEVKKIYLPKYICQALLQPLHKLQVDYTFYPINEDLEPADTLNIGKEEFILYINYFGLKEKSAHSLSQKYSNTIIDNAQAFFSKPCSCSSAFYSPRKFFGVPDGGFAYTNRGLRISLSSENISYKRCAHLLRRLELGPSGGFDDFKANEKKFDNLSMAGMSPLTRKILSGIDYEWAGKIRNQNFKVLHSALNESNQLSPLIGKGTISGPMVYPYLCENKNLRKFLIENNIFVATYWPEILEIANRSYAFEQYLAEHLLPLPVDQRYTRNDMYRVISVVKECDG